MHTVLITLLAVLTVVALGELVRMQCQRMVTGDRFAPAPAGPTALTDTEVLEAA